MTRRRPTNRTTGTNRTKRHEHGHTARSQHNGTAPMHTTTGGGPGGGEAESPAPMPPSPPHPTTPLLLSSLPSTATTLTLPITNQPNPHTPTPTTEPNPTGLSLCHNGPHPPELPAAVPAWPELDDESIGFRSRDAVELAAAFLPAVPPPPRVVQHFRGRLGPVTDGGPVDRVPDRRARHGPRQGLRPPHQGPRPTARPGGRRHARRRTPNRPCSTSSTKPTTKTKTRITIRQRWPASSATSPEPRVAASDGPLPASTGPKPSTLDGASPSSPPPTPTTGEPAAPDPDTAYRHLRALAKRFERATGLKLKGVWKREFQRRGAPHFHVLTPLPAMIGNEPVREWFARSWYEIVNFRR